MIIRKAKVHDLEDILNLNLELFKYEFKRFDQTLNMNWTYSEGKKYFEKRIKGRNGFAVVAENNKKIVGYLCGGLVKISWRNVRAAEIENMFVLPKYRKKGIGTELINAFLEWCKKRKCDTILVTASIFNKDAIEFYKLNKFKEYELTLQRKIS